MEETTIIEWKKRRCASSVWSGTPAGISAGNTSGQGEGETRGLTLSELGREYADTAAALRERVRKVEAELEGETDEQRRLSLSGRLRLLRSMYRDTRETAKLLEHYYDHRKGGDGHARDLL